MNFKKIGINTFIIISLSIICYILFVFIVKNICTKVETFTFTSNEPGPNILFVGTSHGNEPGGGEGLTKLLEDLKSGQIKIKKGKLTVCPFLNPCGKALGLRFQPHQLLMFNHPDLNRNYGKRPGEEGKCEVSKYVENLTKGKDFVLDLHEAWGFHSVDPDSMGGGIYSGTKQLGKEIASHLVTEINKTIVNKPQGGTNPRKIERMKLEDFKFFTKDWPDLPGTLRWYCNNNNIPYVLVETSGQNDIQPLEVRANQNYFLSKEILHYLGMSG